MSKDLFLEQSTNDLRIFNGDLVLIQTQQEATRQFTQVSLQTFRGELFWSTQAGVPWMRNNNNPIQLLGKVTDKRFVDVAIKEDILGREGIIQITSYNSIWDRANRTLSVSFTAETESGEPIIVEDLELEI